MIYVALKRGWNVWRAPDKVCHEYKCIYGHTEAYKQKAAISIDTYCGFRVVLRGFEPRLREPKTLVLPLHHRTIALIVLSTSAVQR